MLRFVLAPGEPGAARTVVADLDARLPGRGMWLSAQGDVLERAASRGAFARAARGPVVIPPDLRASIEQGLRRRLRDRLGLARRASQAVCGFQQVREWLAAGRAALLVEASDGSLAERQRLVGSRAVPLVAALSAEEIGQVFGRDHAVHAAVASGRLAEGLLMDAGRWAGVARGSAPRVEDRVRNGG